MAKFLMIVALSTESTVDQNKENLKLIAGIFEKVADFIIDFDVIISESEIVANIVETVDSLFQWTPSAIEAASSSRYIIYSYLSKFSGITCNFSTRIMRAFERVVSFYSQQIPVNTSQVLNFTSTILVTERVSNAWC